MIEDTKGGRRAQSTARRDEQCRANSRNLFNLSDEPISTKTPVEGATAEFLERVMGILTVALLCDIQSGTDGINDITTRPRRRHGAGDRLITGK